jgi:hypothetical protein
MWSLRNDQPYHWWLEWKANIDKFWSTSLGRILQREGIVQDLPSTRLELTQVEVFPCRCRVCLDGTHG